MATIHLKVVTGEVFTVSNAFYGASGAMATRSDAQIQMGFIVPKLATITVDQGHSINVAQIVYTWVVD